MRDKKAGSVKYHLGRKWMMTAKTVKDDYDRDECIKQADRCFKDAVKLLGFKTIQDMHDYYDKYYYFPM